MKIIAAVLILTTGLVAIEAADASVDSLDTILNKTADFYLTQCNETDTISPEEDANCNRTFNGTSFSKPTVASECQLLRQMEECIEAKCTNYMVIDESIHKNLHTFCCGVHLRGALTWILLSTALVYLIRNALFCHE